MMKKELRRVTILSAFWFVVYLVAIVAMVYVMA